MSDKIKGLINWKNSKYSLISKEYKGVILACSGGADSTVLFHDFIDFFKFENKFKFIIFHTNFSLRNDESDEDESFLNDLANRFNVEFHCYRINSKDKEEMKGKSTQEWARDIRYRELNKFIDSGYAVAFAHNKSDVAENVLLRMARGSSAAGLAGMTEWNAPYWRPLIAVTKEKILAYAKRNNLPYREDSSNAKMEYSRNLIRLKVLKDLETLFPGATARIARLGNEAGELAAFVRESFLFEEMLNGDRFIPLKRIKSQSNAVLKEIIVSLTKPSSGQNLIFDHSFFLEVIKKIKEDTISWSTQTPKGGLLAIKDGLLLFSNKVKSNKAFQSQFQKAFIKSPMNWRLEKNAELKVDEEFIKKILIFKNVGSNEQEIEIKPLDIATFNLIKKESWVKNMSKEIINHMNSNKNWIVCIANNHITCLISEQTYIFNKSYLKILKMDKNKLHINFQ